MWFILSVDQIKSSLINSRYVFTEGCVDGWSVFVQTVQILSARGREFSMSNFISSRSTSQQSKHYVDSRVWMELHFLILDVLFKKLCTIEIRRTRERAFWSIEVWGFIFSILIKFSKTFILKSLHGSTAQSSYLRRGLWCASLNLTTIYSLIQHVFLRFTNL